MVQIGIISAHDSATSAAATEWALVELQGEVECEDDGAPLAGLRLGRLERADMANADSSAAANTFRLTIGHHRLVGKRVALAKPIAVVETVPAAKRNRLQDERVPASPTSMTSTSQSPASSPSTLKAPAASPSRPRDDPAATVERGSYRVVRILRDKIVFKARPEHFVDRELRGKTVVL